MSDENLDGTDSENAPKVLREALEKANKRLAEFEKREQEREAKDRQESLTSILKAKGLKESAASHYQGEVSEEAVVQWASDLGLISEETRDEKDEQNTLGALRAAQLSGSSQSIPLGVTRGPNGGAMGAPEKIMELLQADGLTYEDYVRLGIFPKDPNVI